MPLTIESVSAEITTTRCTPRPATTPMRATIEPNPRASRFPTLKLPIFMECVWLAARRRPSSSLCVNQKSRLSRRVDQTHIRTAHQLLDVDQNEHPLIHGAETDQVFGIERRTKLRRRTNLFG